MGNIVGESLRKYVVQQINARQALHGSGVFKPSRASSTSDSSLIESFNRTDSQLNILNSNTSWIKLASGVYLSGSEGSNRLKDIGFLDIEIPNLIGDGLAKNFILYGGTSTLETNQNGNLVTTQRQGFLENFDPNSSYMYSYTPVATKEGKQYKSADFGYSPMPGIISAEIKSLNRGSLEKAFIKIKANDRRQLDILDILYMRLGYTVLLEWGNSLYTKTGTDRENVRQTLIEKKFFQVGKNRSYFDFLGYGGTQLIDQERARYDGNYDGMLAVVSNFSWVFNPDGTYDIDLTLISMGDVVESLKSNVSIDSKLKGFIKNSPELSTASPGSEESPIEKNKDANIITSALWLFKRFGPNASQKVNIVLGNGDTKNVGNLLKNGPSELSVYSNTYKLEYRTKDGYTIDPNIGSTTISDNIGDLKTNSTITINSAFPDDEADNKLRELYNDPKTYKGDQPEQNPPINKASKSKHTIKISYRIKEDTTVSTGGYGSTTLTSISDRGKHVAVQWTKVSSTTTSTFENPIDSAHYDDACVINNTTQQYYLRFGYLLQFLTEKVIPLIKSDNDPPLFDIDYSTWSNHMYSLPNQISLDPRVCIVKNLDFKKAKGKGTAKVFEKLRQFKENDNKNAAYPMNIYLNFEFIISSLESNTNDRGDVNLYGFISSICTGLNKALGGINNLEPIIDKDENVLRILDSTPIPGYSCPALSDTNKYELNLFGYKKEGTKNNINLYSSTFVRKVDLKTAITPEYATMVTVGATANGYVKGTEATAFSRWNKGIIDRFKDELVSPNPATQTQTSGQDEPEYNYINEFLNKITACYGYDGDLSSSDNPGNINSDIIEQNLSIVTEFYKYIIAKAGQKTQQAGTIGFIPFKLGITMDGISGIKIYNKLEVNSRFLPTKYGETLNFIITGVSHRLQDNDWETVLETIVMPKTTAIDKLDIDITNISDQVAASSNSPLTEIEGTTYGVIGYSNIAKLFPKALTKDQIETVKADAFGKVYIPSPTPQTVQPQFSLEKNSLSIRERIVLIALSYVGQPEYGNNAGYSDPAFQTKMKGVGWSSGQMWCGFFQKLVWKEAYTTGNAIVPAAPENIKNIWDTTAKNIPSPVPGNEKNNARQYKKWSPITEDQKYLTYTQPGDLAVFKSGHGEVVIKVHRDTKGKITKVDTVGGNSGDKVSYNKGTKLSSLKGFAQVITP